MEVTEPSTGPDSIRAVLVDDALHHRVLLRSLDAHQVHAHASTDVPCIQPTNLPEYICFTCVKWMVRLIIEKPYGFLNWIKDI